ncbi:MAG: efflux RND transporter periplasmic adaptor subunit [Salibacteraceae bacterium]
MKGVKIRRSIIFAILFILISVIVGRVLSGMKTPPAENNGAETLNSVTVVRVHNAKHPVKIDIDGRLISKQRFEVYTEVNGRLLATQKPFKDGVAFTKGEVLLKLDDSDQRMAVVAARSAFLSLLTNLLPDIKVDHPDEFDAWQAYTQSFDPNSALPDLPEVNDIRLRNLLIAKNVYNQFYNIKAQEEVLSKYTITAPFDGIVTQANLNSNTILRAGQRVGVFLEAGNFEMESSISLAERKYVEPGNRAVLHNPNGDNSWKGKVSRMSEAIEPSTQSVKVYIDVAGDELYEGLFLEGHIVGDSLPAVASIPMYLLFDKEYVFTVTDSTLQRSKVRVLHTYGDTAMVAGLDEGTYLVYNVVPGGHDGMKVSPILKTEE